ncbi:hypothetical protein ACWIWK_06020 [Helicobacter sp. 23-1048]
MEHWVNIDGFGALFIEQELARLDIPFIFVCLDDNNMRYLALCYNDRDYKYILAKCDSYSLIQILKGKLSIDTFIQKSDKIFLLDLIDWDKAIIQEMVYTNLSNEVLPKKDTFFTIENKSIDDYIEKLKSETIAEKMLYKNINNLCIASLTINNKQKSIENIIQLVENIIPHDNILELLQIDKIDNVSKNTYKVDKGVANGQGKKGYFTSAA